MNEMRGKHRGGRVKGGGEAQERGKKRRRQPWVAFFGAPPPEPRSEIANHRTGGTGGGEVGETLRESCYTTLLHFNDLSNLSWLAMSSNRQHRCMYVTNLPARLKKKTCPSSWRSDRSKFSM